MTPEADVRVIRQRADSLVENHRRLMQSLIGMRAKHQLTQAEVAERMGVSQPTVAAFERYDSNPTLSTLRRYALAVNALLVDDVLDACGRELEKVDVEPESTATTGISSEPIGQLARGFVFLVSEPAPSAWWSVPAGTVRAVHDVEWSPLRNQSAFHDLSDEWEPVVSKLPRTHG